MYALSPRSRHFPTTRSLSASLDPGRVTPTSAAVRSSTCPHSSHIAFAVIRQLSPKGNPSSSGRQFATRSRPARGADEVRTRASKRESGEVKGQPQLCCAEITTPDPISRCVLPWLQKPESVGCCVKASRRNGRKGGRAAPQGIRYSGGCMRRRPQDLTGGVVHGCSDRILRPIIGHA